ncbi:helix-turn-helix domain-containing protein [Kitasatospora sp. NPDC057223]|uniref:helix-turn-helix domain-containing protein n=1 Tax=Kitasatospora sp. NPDC057223 TaxID=3346055 RepID=UPI00363B84EA
MPEEGARVAGFDALAVLELLSGEAPAARIRAWSAEARPADPSGPDLTALERATELGLDICSRLERCRQHEAGLAALVDTARDLAVPYDLDTLLRVVTRRARLLLGVDMSWISFRDDSGGATHVRTSDGHVPAFDLGLQGPDGAGPAGQAPFWTPDYLADERIHHDTIDKVVRAEGLRAIMAVPLTCGSRPFGTLHVADRSVRHFSREEVSLIGSLGDLAGVAIEKARILDRANSAVSGLDECNAQAEAGLRAVRELSDIHNRLIELVLNGDDPYALAASAARQLGGAVRIHRADGTVLTTAGEMPDGDRSTESAASMEAHAARAPVRLAGGLWAAPIRAGDATLGTLLLRTETPLTDRNRELLGLVAQAAAVLMLLRSGGPAHGQSQGQGHDELLDDLLTSPQLPPQQLEKRARRLGIDLSGPHLVILARPEGEAEGKIATWATLHAHRSGGLKCVRNGSAVLLLPGTDPGATAQAVSDELTPLLGRPVTVSAAGPVSDPASVFHCYQEAVRCLDAMTALGATGRSASARELGFFGVLLSDTHDVEGFVEAAIGPVLDHDRQRFTELTRTLDAYFESGSSPTHAAQRLHVHPNTVARRLERITELLGPAWQQPERSLEVQLALRLARIRRLLLDRRASPVEGGPGA